jgi:hypothetical protein
MKFNKINCYSILKEYSIYLISLCYRYNMFSTKNVSNPHYPVRTEFDEFMIELKQIYDKDKSVLTQIKNYTHQQKEEQRQKITNVMSTHTKNDSNQPLYMNALLPSSVNIILEARKRILANEKESVSICIEQDGWVGQLQVRPEYKVTIKRY